MILITGSAGFIGFHLARRLLDQGQEVAGFDNLNGYYDVGLKRMRLDILRQYKNFIFFKGDLENREELKQVFQTCGPEIVVHLAAQAGVRYSITHPDAYVSTNLVGFYHVLELCRQYSVRHLLYASSSSVYGGNAKVPFAVDDKTDSPVSLYAATKKANEVMAYSYSSLYGIPATGLRFFTVYGPYGRPDMAYFSFADAIMEGRPVTLFNYGEMERDFTYIDDIVEGIRRLVFRPPAPDGAGVPAKLYNIGNHHTEKLSYFIDVLEECLGKKAVREYAPMQKGDVRRTFADVSELERDTGFSPGTTLREGLEEFARWYMAYRKELLTAEGTG